MDLICLWIDKLRDLNDVMVVLNHNYSIKKNIEKNVFEFIVEELYDTQTLYSNDKIIDSYLLLGKNGTGKTTVIDVLTGLNTLNGEKFIVLFRSKENFYIYHQGYNIENLKGKLKMQIKYISGGVMKYQNQNSLKFFCYWHGYSLKINMKNNICRNIRYENSKEYSDKENNKKNNIYIKDNLYCYIYGKMSNNFFKSYIQELSELEKFESLVLNWNVVFSYNRNKTIQIDLPLRYTEIFQRLDKGLEEISIYYLVKLFFNNMISIFWGINDRFKFDQTINTDEHKKIKAFINDNYNYERDNIEKYVDKVRNESFNCTNDINGLIDRMKLFVVEFYDKIEKFNINIDLLKKENDILLEIIEDLINYVYKQKDFLYLENSKIKFEYKMLFDSTFENTNGNYEFSKRILEKYADYVSFKFGDSSGEQAYIELFACIVKSIKEFEKDISNSEKCFIFLDEIETHLHPEWCRLLLKNIYELINNNAIRHKYLIYITTHSPYIISDFTSDHIINLGNDKDVEFHTFGANIHDILNKGMFLSNSMGEFAYQCISDVINDLEGNYDKPKYDDETIEYIINCIGEPFIKNHLKLLYKKKKNKEIIQKYEDMTREELIERLKRYEYDQNRN